MKNSRILHEFENYKQKFEEGLPRYHELLGKLYPDKLRDPWERFQETGLYNDKTVDLCRELFNSMQILGWRPEVTEDYNDLLTIVESNNDFTYDDLNPEKSKLPKNDIKFIEKFKGQCSIYHTLGIIIGAFKAGKRFDFVPKDYIDQKMKFIDETVVITDPCYVLSSKDENKNYIKSTEYKYISNHTIYGDWSCTVFSDDKKELGQFCADSGQVAVFKGEDLTDEFFKWAKEHAWCVTVIPNFLGTVTIKIKIADRVSMFNTFECYVEGKGNINFISSQTGL